MQTPTDYQDQADKLLAGMKAGNYKVVDLTSIKRKLEEMGVVDVKVSRDGDEWNSLPEEARAEAIYNVLAGYTDERYHNDNHQI